MATSLVGGLLLAVVLAIPGCRREEQRPPQPPKEASPQAPPASQPPPASTAPVPATLLRYRPLAIEGATWLAKLTTEWGNEKTLTFLKVNRVDLKHVRQGETLVLPGPMNDLLSLSPLPREIEMARSIPKLLLVSRRVQAFAAYESGKLVQWGPTLIHTQ